jgi:hypothetical protein
MKEAMMDHLGGAPAVGAAAFAVQFAIARELLASGVGLILEGCRAAKSQSASSSSVVDMMEST